MELADLRTFVVVVEETSFTRAAAHLCRTQPAVSQAIRRLESTTGAKLLVRSRGGGVSLTPAGERLVTYARRMLAISDQARAAIVNLREIGRAVPLSEPVLMREIWLVGRSKPAMSATAQAFMEIVEHHARPVLGIVDCAGGRSASSRKHEHFP
jgi:DNA-binding transcriptional LysR family regulator